MKTIIMFETSWCPYCKKAHKFMDELMKENPRYKNLKIQIIDEEQEPEVANSYDYYYVPTYYLESEKVHEGVPNKKVIEKLFNSAIS